MKPTFFLILASAAALGAATTSVAIAVAEAPPSIAALSQGEPVTLAPAELALVQSLAAYGPDAGRARRLAAPAGETWTILPAAGGGACILVPSGTAVCGAGGGIANGRYGVISVDKPSPAVAARQAADRRALIARDPAADGGAISAGPAEPAVRRGVVPDGVAAVQAIGADGAVLGAGAVAHNAYVLPLGLEGQATAIRLIGSGGEVIAESELS